MLAQQRLFVLSQHEIIEIDTNLASLGHVIRRAATPFRGLSLPGPVPVAGGALLAWTTPHELVLFDTGSGSLQRHALPGVGGRVLGASRDSFSVLVSVQLLEGRSERTLVFVAGVRDGTVRQLDLGPNVEEILYAARRDALFVRKASGVVEVRRADDGSLLQTVPVVSGLAFRLMSVNPTATRLVVAVGSEFQVFDVVSGAMLARSPGVSLPSHVVLDEHRRRLLVGVGAGSTSAAASLETPFIAALAFDTLEVIGRADLPTVTLSPQPLGHGFFASVELDVSDKSATIYAIETVYDYTYNDRVPACKPSVIVAMQVDTGALRRSADFTHVTGRQSCEVRLVRLTEPAAPSGLSAHVTGRSVSLSWGAEAATHYEIEAGTAPGLANLATIPVNDTEFVVDGVPPGTYHVRVRAINTIGRSAASQDIQVVVP